MTKFTVAIPKIWVVKVLVFSSFKGLTGPNFHTLQECYAMLTSNSIALKVGTDKIGEFTC